MRDPERVRYILEFVEEVKEIAYSYEHAEGAAERAIALRRWQEAADEMGLVDVPAATGRVIHWRRRQAQNRTGSSRREQE